MSSVDTVAAWGKSLRSSSSSTRPSTNPHFTSSSRFPTSTVGSASRRTPCALLNKNNASRMMMTLHHSNPTASKKELLHNKTTESQSLSTALAEAIRDHELTRMIAADGAAMLQSQRRGHAAMIGLNDSHQHATRVQEARSVHLDPAGAAATVFRISDGASRASWWRAVLRLPFNEEAFHTLSLRRPQQSAVDRELAEVAELLTFDRDRRCAARLWGALTQHEPKLSQIPFLMYLCVAVNRGVGNNPICAFETAFHFLLNTCNEWIAAFPRPPTTGLERFDAFMANYPRTRRLWLHLNSDALVAGCSFVDYLWLPLQTFCLFSFDPETWMRLFDDIVSRSDGALFFHGLVLAMTIHFEEALLKCTHKTHVHAVMTTKIDQPLAVQRIVRRANVLATRMVLPMQPLRDVPPCRSFYPLLVETGRKPAVPPAVDKSERLKEIEMDEAELERKLKVELQVLSTATEMRQFHSALHRDLEKREVELSLSFVGGEHPTTTIPTKVMPETVGTVSSDAVEQKAERVSSPPAPTATAHSTAALQQQTRAPPPPSSPPSTQAEAASLHQTAKGRIVSDEVIEIAARMVAARSSAASSVAARSDASDGSAQQRRAISEPQGNHNDVVPHHFTHPPPPPSTMVVPSLPPTSSSVASRSVSIMGVGTEGSGAGQPPLPHNNNSLASGRNSSVGYHSSVAVPPTTDSLTNASENISRSASTVLRVGEK